MLEITQKAILAAKTPGILVSETEDLGNGFARNHSLVAFAELERFERTAYGIRRLIYVRYSITEKSYDGWSESQVHIPIETDRYVPTNGSDPKAFWWEDPKTKELIPLTNTFSIY
jgi:hypothetical protein